MEKAHRPPTPFSYREVHMLDVEEPMPSADPQSPGLVRARRAITVARTRGATPSDGGSTGRSDGND